METRGWQSKGDKAPRRSPRRQRKTCGRPFTAPRKAKSAKTVPQVKTSEVELVLQDGQDTQDSQVQQISGTENDRDIEARAEQEDVETRGIEARAEQEARLSSDEDGDNTPRSTLASDTSGSTLDILKSAVQSEGRVPGAFVTDTIRDYVIQASPTSMTYQGPTFIPETEMQESSEDRPLVRALRNRQKITLSLQQITDCQDGPKGDRALGVKIAKAFGGYEYRGTVDEIRGDKYEGYIYHVEYEDGDEEELSQIELRDCYILGLGPEIEASCGQHSRRQTPRKL
jgi:hypothetical protein